ncbi:type II-A CRISPR-associated protein Csn2 [Bavariicoccus seileri]|uniref:type II-A CRISPR-associated protein Csn2 n=1 Tax=Bavariicoccus seileri TaxID=549685 RepID=UPI00047DCE78|nr:type II-A CRISPR-associated protein Csn2 [Bavariicoccus seileri]
MKLNFPLLDDPIELVKSTVLVINDVPLFARLNRAFYHYDDQEDVKLYDLKYKPVKSTELLVITDFLGFDVNSSTVLKLVYADLEQQLNEKPEVKSMIDKLTATITELIGYELLEHDLDLEVDEITIIELFKALGIKIETLSDTIYEKLIEIIQIFKYLSKKKLLVLVNACLFLSASELEELCQYISLSNVNVLFLETKEIDQQTVENLEVDQYLIDSDYYVTKIS